MDIHCCMFVCAACRKRKRKKLNLTFLDCFHSFREIRSFLFWYTSQEGSWEEKKERKKESLFGEYNVVNPATLITVMHPGLARISGNTIVRIFLTFYLKKERKSFVKSVALTHRRLFSLRKHGSKRPLLHLFLPGQKRWQLVPKLPPAISVLR